MKYDILIVGGVLAGLRAAIEAKSGGAKTAVLSMVFDLKKWET